jgi:hypothetical protein
LENCALSGNAASVGGGSYGYDATLNNCTVSANFALWSGGGSANCTLNNCSLTGNSTDGDGGGSYHGQAKSTTFAGNSAAGLGGGAYSGWLTNCLILNNGATIGGAVAGDEGLPYLYNCTLVGNTANTRDGGAAQGTLRNSIMYANSAPEEYHEAEFSYSCVPAASIPGVGNITNAPLFVDTHGWADLRLQSNSPCINAGNNAYVANTNDLDGNPRMVGGTVDMGAYEFQSPLSAISYAWLQQYGLPTDGSVDLADGDNDQATTWQEWKAWTNPTNALSVLRMLNPEPGTNGSIVSWQSVPGHGYQLERATHGTAAFTLLQSGLAGQAGTTSFTDTTATNGEAFLYRVGVAAE